MILYMKTGGGKDSEDHDHNGHRNLRKDFFADADQNQRADSHSKRKQTDRACGKKNIMEKFRKFSGAGTSSHKFRNLHQDDRKRNSADKATHNRGGDKINDPIRMQEIKNEQPQSGKKCDYRYTGKCIGGFSGNTKRDKCTSDDGGRCGIYTKNKLL